ncbi:unnamed protein product [Rotaria sordida]|uniref:F-box domain-containing protein n=2 Tax=Rotaria sordida TaxID=392033 RepID=A0A819AG52_9BILA|nr:unnamed protein product [Rotaria sordida]CAF3784655.1 unnamed protein product [Rotaria sordida]
MKNRLEQLPNELLWLILEYISPIDLFHKFFNLNQRFNTILRLIHYRFNLLYTNQNQFKFFLNIILPNIEYNWIESLYIDDITNRLYIINKCQYLRSLTIHHLHTENINLLVNNVLLELKQLNYLHLYTEFRLRDHDVNSLTYIIFSQQMPSLTYCYLDFQDYSRMSFDHLDITNKTLSLKTLVIDQWCRLRDFIRLLHFIPNIKRLTVRLFDSNTKGTIVPSLNAIDDFTTLVPHLIFLRAKLAEIPFIIATKILFLRLPSKLHELSLSTWSIEYGNGDLWETILSSKFPYLKHFRLIISLDQIPHTYITANNLDLDNIVKSFNQSKYFLDHHWNVLININEHDRLKFVLHTIPYPIENFQTTLYNIRRCTISPLIIKSTYHYVSKLSLTLHNNLTSLLYDYNEYRYFPNIEQFILYSNLINNSRQFQSIEYFNNLKTMINLSNIILLNCPEETRQYPIELINLLLKNLPKLKTLIVSYRLYTYLQTQSIYYLKNLTLIFAIYSSISPPTTRMRYLLTPNQILTNELILELVRTSFSVFSELQTLTLIVRDLDGFDNQFSEWLKTNFPIEQNILYDFLIFDKIVRFYF